MQVKDNTPILIGAGQKTWRETDTNRTPVDALQEACSAALADAGGNEVTDAVDTIGTVRFIADASPGGGAVFPRNPGIELAARLGITDPALFLGFLGGNSPQYLVNYFANQLADGQREVVLLAGAELLATFFSALRTGGDISGWAGNTRSEPTVIGKEKEGCTALETAHGMFEPINTYPLFENSLRHHLGLDQRAHTGLIADLSSRMSQVAADNPMAWHQKARTAEQIQTVEKKNRYIGFPYTRAMNPVLEVDMAAAVVMTTVGKARKLGVDPKQWVYLRGGADANDSWYVSERASLHDSPAIAAAWHSVREQSSINLDEIGHFDIYSCFPSAVQVSCRALGLSPLDPRGVTVTGGLPFFGGPGNNYSLHAICEMISKLRNSGGHGLVTANGYYLTKHSLGLYSAEAPTDDWQPLNSAPLQNALDKLPLVTVAKEYCGEATLESYTVCFDREGPKRGLILARNSAGERIVANTDLVDNTLEQLMQRDPIGQKGRISQQDGINLFAF